MAINTEFIDFIIPIDTIRKKYPGGWEQCLIDHAPYSVVGFGMTIIFFVTDQ